MDNYEREWRRVAQSRSWTQIMRWNETEHYYWRREVEYEKRRAERIRKAKLRDQYYETLTPVENWVGACWVSPKGEKYPVEYSNHWHRAYVIVREVLHVTLDETTSPDTYLVERLHWARISASGDITDDQWRSIEQLTSEQYAVISEMALLAANGTAIWCQGGEVQDFLDNISYSLRLANEQDAISA